MVSLTMSTTATTTTVVHSTAFSTVSSTATVITMMHPAFLLVTMTFAPAIFFPVHLFASYISIY
jgi:hypothetical protein